MELHGGRISAQSDDHETRFIVVLPKKEKGNFRMKFIHTSDLHLGVRPDAGPEYTKRRPEEIWGDLQSILDRCEDEQIDLLLISGDVFHRQPLLRELKELNAMFAGLSHTKVVFTAGNHDYLNLIPCTGISSGRAMSSRFWKDAF